LRVDLSVLKLFVSVPLDPLKQRTQRLLLFLSKKGLLSFDDVLDPVVDKVVVLLLFQLLTLHLQELCLFVSFLKR